MSLTTLVKNYFADAPLRRTGYTLVDIEGRNHAPPIYQKRDSIFNTHPNGRTTEQEVYRFAFFPTRTSCEYAEISTPNPNEFWSFYSKETIQKFDESCTEYWAHPVGDCAGALLNIGAWSFLMSGAVHRDFPHIVPFSMRPSFTIGLNISTLLYGLFFCGVLYAGAVFSHYTIKTFYHLLHPPEKEPREHFQEFLDRNTDFTSFDTSSALEYALSAEPRCRQILRT